MQTETKTQWYWLLHHKILLEVLTEPVENRIDYIKNYKPKNEQKVRLSHLQPVKNVDRLPVEIVQAYDAYCKAYVTYCKAYAAYIKTYNVKNKTHDAYVIAWDVYNKAYDAYRKALSDHYQELVTLHKEEYPECNRFDYKKKTLVYT